MREYRHLQYEDRLKFEALTNCGVSKYKIMKELNISRSTYYRELARGQRDKLTSEYEFIRVYCADTAQRDYDYNATNKGPDLKVGNDYDFIKYMENMIVNKKYSPYAALAEIKRRGLEFECGGVSINTIYNYIDSGDVFQNVTRDSLFMKGKRKRNYDKIKRVRVKKPLLKSIDDRPKEIESRDECGHWEMDTVAGQAAGKNPVLLVLTERKSRAEIIEKISGKTQEAVIAALDKIERDMRGNFSKVFKTITIDNGGEFLNEKGIEQSVFGGVRTVAYFCHPYSSFERGSNENCNKIIRRFVPKGEDIGKYTSEDIKAAQDWINNYPRRILGGKSAGDILLVEMGWAI